MGFLKELYQVEIPDQNTQIVGTARERGEAFITAFITALETDGAQFKIGFGIGHGSYGDDKQKLMGVVVAEINNSYHAFPIEEARNMADSMERTMNKISFDDAVSDDVMQNAIMALREAANRIENADLQALAKEAGLDN